MNNGDVGKRLGHFQAFGCSIFKHFEPNLWISRCVLVIDGATLGLILFVLSDGHLIQGPAHHRRDHPVFRIQLFQHGAQLYAIPFLYTHPVLFGVIKEVQVLWLVEVKLIRGLRLGFLQASF